MKTKLFILGSIIPISLAGIVMTSACSLGGIVNRPTPPAGPNNPSQPSNPTGPDYSDIGSIEIPTEIITELPKENITKNTSILPLGKLAKYVLEIPKIQINNLPLTLEEQKERYLDVLEYISGYRDGNPTNITNAKPNSFYDHAELMAVSLGQNDEEDENVGKVISKLNEYMIITERIFYLEKDE